MRARRTRRILPWSFYTPSVAARWMSGNQVHGPPTAFEFVRSGSCLMYSRWRGAIVAGQRGGPLLRFASCFDVTKSEQRKERKKAWREREREREKALTTHHWAVCIFSEIDRERFTPSVASDACEIRTGPPRREKPLSVSLVPWNFPAPCVTRCTIFWKCIRC